MNYTQAPATRMLATHCVVCGRPLVDDVSVETGIGPECREKAGIVPDVSAEVQAAGNKLVFEAALAAGKGHAERVLALAEQIKALGFERLGDLVATRFQVTEASVAVTIELTPNGAAYTVVTPFRRGDREAFVDAWRSIPGRRYVAGVNVVPVAQKAALWTLLRRFFPGKWGKGPQGLFRIPKNS